MTLDFEASGTRAGEQVRIVRKDDSVAATAVGAKRAA
jgi:hypothetical protein